MKNITRIKTFFFLLIAGFLVSPQTNAAELLIFGDYSRGSLATDLTNLGHNVTDNGATLPADLSGYDAIWHVAAFAPLTAGEQSQLAAFLADGGGVHLTGERPCCETLNDSIQAFLDTVVIGGGVTVGDEGDIGGPYNMNPAATGGIGTTPNALTTWSPSASGGMGGLGSLPDSNILVTGAGDIPTGAVWVGADLVSGGGRLTVLMDVNWFANSSANNLEVLENIVTFQTSAQVGISSQPLPVPTLSEWALMLMAALIVLLALTWGRRSLV